MGYAIKRYAIKWVDLYKNVQEFLQEKLVKRFLLHLYFDFGM